MLVLQVMVNFDIPCLICTLIRFLVVTAFSVFSCFKVVDVCVMLEIVVMATADRSRVGRPCCLYKVCTN